MKQFERIAQEAPISVACFDDVRGADLSSRNFSDVSPNVLRKLDYDTRTVWPSPERLPNGFDPEQVLEEGKKPGLGTPKLHEQGITGQGVVVAIIDRKLYTGHPEYAEALAKGSYSEYGDAGSEEFSMHGSAVASLLVGKECGVAPGVSLVFKAIPSSESGYFKYYADALIDIVDNNKNATEHEKIRVVSCSIGYVSKKEVPEIKIWTDALQLAKKAGIFVVDCRGDQIGVPFALGGSPGDKDDFESYVPSLYRTDEDDEMDELLSQGTIDEILTKLKDLRERKETFSHLMGIPDPDLRTMVEEYLAKPRNNIVIPSDYRTMASPHEGQYIYNGRGAGSWSVPILAGLVALALQVNPNLTQEEMSDIINDSTVTNSKGLRIVNPEGIVQLAQRYLRQSEINA